jgi:hypothetical protein
MKDLAIIVPTRGRPSNIEDLLFSLQETHTTSELIIVLDDDDAEADHYFDLGVRTLVYPREGKGMARPLNRAAWELIDEFANFCFLGDDHRPRTENWDQKFIDELNRLGTGLVYGNDLLQGENLPTAVAMTRDIVEELHGMVPPGLAHLYLDNFWLQLGKDLGAITYLPLVIIEHLHPVAGKAEWDAGYKEVNADDVYNADSKAFWEYIGGEDYQKLLYGLEHK